MNLTIGTAHVNNAIISNILKVFSSTKPSKLPFSKMNRRSISIFSATPSLLQSSTSISTSCSCSVSPPTSPVSPSFDVPAQRVSPMEALAAFWNENIEALSKRERLVECLQPILDMLFETDCYVHHGRKSDIPSSAGCSQ